MAATRASGTNAVRYGTMRENVMSLTVVLADGRVIKTARRARKSAAGYDLTRLFVGSEGTLGIITEVTVRLYAMQEAMSAAVCAFEDIAGAVDTVIQTMQSGIPIARCEALCATTMRAINAYSKTNYREQPTLFLEFHGTEASVEEQAGLVQEIAHENGGMDFQWATKAEDRTKLWEARHDAYFACLQLRPARARRDRRVRADLAPGRVHRRDREGHRARLDADSRCSATSATATSTASSWSPGQRGRPRRSARFNERLVKRALAMEGTCTGEHGIGLGKMKWLPKELGEAVDLMRDIKRTFDPDNLMNPGKVVSPEA